MQSALAEAFGGGEKGRRIAEFITTVADGLPLPPSAAPAPNRQTLSSPVKDSQGWSRIKIQVRGPKFESARASPASAGEPCLFAKG